MVEPILARFGLGDPEWLDPATAGAIVLIAILVAFVLHKVVFPLIIRFTKWTPTDLDSRLVRSARWPVSLGILVLGVYLALTLPLDLTDTQQARTDTVAKVLAVVLGIFLVVGLLSKTVDWYLENLAGKTQGIIDVKLFPLIRRVAVVFIYGLGALLVMDLLGINISPLIA
ncbi:MAG: hypothetical protein J4N70_08660, partial [Chloroflexi bacterium]|nr:hypothetical protein [Chloroflexota bacterium]